MGELGLTLDLSQATLWKRLHTRVYEGFDSARL